MKLSDPATGPGEPGCAARTVTIREVRAGNVSGKVGLISWNGPSDPAVETVPLGAPSFLSSTGCVSGLETVPKPSSTAGAWNQSARSLETASFTGFEEPPYLKVAMQALLDDGPMQGKRVEMEPVEGRPPKTIEVSDEEGSAYRYGLAEWKQKGMTAVYTFLYAH
jgi:hypothetical protein